MESSPTRKQLINVIGRLKTQMKNMQELFEAQDEERHQEIQSLLKERKELKEKIELLETKISNHDNFSSSLASTTSSNPTLFEHETTTITESGCCGSSHGLSDSLQMMYVEDYEKLQESYQQLFDEKTYLEAKVHEMTSCLQDLQETAEELQKKSDEQQEIIERLVSENQRLTFTNEDLYKAVTESEQLKNEAVEVVVAEPPKSLFEELKEAGAIDESLPYGKSLFEELKEAGAMDESLHYGKSLFEELKEAGAMDESLPYGKSLFEELKEAGAMDESLHYGKSLFEELQEVGAMDESLPYGTTTIEEAVDPAEDVYEDAKTDNKKQVVELCQGKKSPRLSYVKKPLIRLLSVFSVFADAMVKLDQPILYSLYSDVFVLQTRPNIS